MDSWTDTPLIFKFPHLFSFALDNDISLERLSILWNHDDIDTLFYLPLSLVAASSLKSFPL
jgi:hypothetical protein